MCDYMHACVVGTACVAEYATPSLPPSIYPSHMQVYLRGLLCTKCGLVQAALEPLAGCPSTLPGRALLCYAVLCLLSWVSKGTSVCCPSWQQYLVLRSKPLQVANCLPWRVMLY